MKTALFAIACSLCLVAVGLHISTPPHVGSIYRCHPSDPFDRDPYDRTAFKVAGVSNGYVDVICLGNGLEWHGTTRNFWRQMKELHASREK